MPNEVIDEWSCFDFLTLADITLDLDVQDLPSCINLKREVNND